MKRIGIVFFCVVFSTGSCVGKNLPAALQNLTNKLIDLANALEGREPEEVIQLQKAVKKTVGEKSLSPGN